MFFSSRNGLDPLWQFSAFKHNNKRTNTPVRHFINLIKVWDDLFDRLLQLHSNWFTSIVVKTLWQRQINHLGNNLQGDCADIEQPDGSNGTCVFSDQCSKVTCTSPPDSTGPFGHMIMTVQAYGCQPLIATVTMETFQTPMKWSHTFEDGEQAPLPIQVSAGPVNVKLFLKVELKKVGGKIHFKVACQVPSFYL